LAAQYPDEGAVMVNEKHLRILKSGVQGWNDWRRSNPNIAIDLSLADLSDSNLTGVDLGDADLSGAAMTGTNLSSARLYRAKMRQTTLMTANLMSADLRQADLTIAVLHRANFFEANLQEADLSYSNFTDANLADVLLDGANFQGARFGTTHVSGVSLVPIRGLETVAHLGPSSISVDTLERTAADLAKDPSRQGIIETFLENAGVPKEYLDLFRSRIGQPIQFYSSFISYSTKDQEFADRLYADLKQKRIRCWLATEDLKIGDKFRTRINDAIRIHDKLLVVLSQHSVKSAWVEDEVEAAFERERRDGTTVLFPIRLDDAVMESDAAWAATIRRTRHIGDFTKWKDHDAYQKALTGLIRDLQNDATTARAGGR
jgi:uncharacterized protein YjbI with pentapeptide repeats